MQASKARVQTVER